MKTFRSIHYLCIAAYVGALLHGLYAGTDSPLTQLDTDHVLGTFLSSAFFSIYWLVFVRLTKREKNAAPMRMQKA